MTTLEMVIAVLMWILVFGNIYDIYRKSKKE